MRPTDVFVWDEVPMAPHYALEIMDRKLRDVINNYLLFGGKIVILDSDFRQLLLVLPRGIRSEIVNLSKKNSFLWNNIYKSIIFLLLFYNIKKPKCPSVRPSVHPSGQPPCLLSSSLWI